MTALLETIAKNNKDKALSTQTSSILRNDCEMRRSIHSAAFMRIAQVASRGIFRFHFAATHSHTYTHVQYGKTRNRRHSRVPRENEFVLNALYLQTTDS